MNQSIGTSVFIFYLLGLSCATQNSRLPREVLVLSPPEELPYQFINHLSKDPIRKRRELPLITIEEEDNENDALPKFVNRNHFSPNKALAFDRAKPKTPTRKVNEIETVLPLRKKGNTANIKRRDGLSDSSIGIGQQRIQSILKELQKQTPTNEREFESPMQKKNEAKIDENIEQPIEDINDSQLLPLTKVREPEVYRPRKLITMSHSSTSDDRIPKKNV